MSRPLTTAHCETAPGGGSQFPPASGSACVSCGAPARLRNEDGQYCLDCMKLHLLEKSLVQITNLARPVSISPTTSHAEAAAEYTESGRHGDCPPNAEVSGGRPRPFAAPSGSHSESP